MTKEKWNEIVNFESNALSVTTTFLGWAPLTWPERKKAYMKFVKAVDEATEVYNLENKKNV